MLTRWSNLSSSFILITCIWRKVIASDGFFSGSRGSHFFFNEQSVGGRKDPVDNQGYYDCLHIKRGADDSTIKKAYRKLAVKLHPDKQGGDPEKFKELGEAYAVLSDPEKRKIYDRYGKQGLEGRSGFTEESTSDFAEDIFSALFGGHRRGRSSGFRGPARAADATYELEVSLADLYTGGTRRIQVYTQKVKRNGSAVRVPKYVDIVIEPGMRSGAAIVLRGEQDPGIPGVMAGDLIFVIRESPPDPSSGGFSRIGDHLVVDMDITLVESLLGFCRPLCHLDGTTLKVTGRGGIIKPGDLRRLQSRGMPKQGSPGEFGDLYIRFGLIFPSEEEVASWTEEQKQMLASLLSRPPDFPWKDEDNGNFDAIEPPDPLVARAIERGAGGIGQDSYGGEAGSFFRFFGL